MLLLQPPTCIKDSSPWYTYTYESECTSSCRSSRLNTLIMHDVIVSWPRSPLLKKHALSSVNSQKEIMCTKANLQQQNQVQWNLGYTLKLPQFSGTQPSALYYLLYLARSITLANQSCLDYQLFYWQAKNQWQDHVSLSLWWTHLHNILTHEDITNCIQRNDHCIIYRLKQGIWMIRTDQDDKDK
jgi:hypothetical protein